MDLHLPMDFESWPEFRRLRADVGQPAAMLYFMRLLVELGQLAQVSPLGIMDESSAALLADSVRGDPEQTMGCLSRAGLLEKTDQGWRCGRFARTQGHLDPSYLTVHRKGNLVSNYMRGLNKYSMGEAMQQNLLIPPAVWVDPDGKKIDPEMQKRVMMLITMVDRAIARPERHPSEYTEGLVHDAWRALQAHTSDQLTAVCKWLLCNRENAAVPRTSESLLARFAEVAVCAMQSLAEARS